MIGPVIGSMASGSAILRPGFIASALCLVALAFSWRWLPESKGKASDAGDPFGQAPRKGVIWSTVREILVRPHRGIGSLVWIYALGMMAFMAMNAILVLYFERRFGITEKTIGWFFLYVASVSLVMRALLLGPLIRRFGEIVVLRAGTLCMVLGFVAIPAARSIWELAAAAIFIPAGTALLFPATTSLVSAKAQRAETGVVLGVHQGFGGVARMVGPLWSGAMFDVLGIRTPFWAAAALMAVVSLFAYSVHKPQRAPKKGPEAEPVVQA
jgi:predicted MFS family arabinose efflux permease